ncbi:MAG: glycosyltransferase family 10 [Ruminococcus sp.]|nr:glycosyltransferase family 10 [Ruminococcus sp.]
MINEKMKSIKVHFEDNGFMFKEVRNRLAKYYILEESDAPDFVFVSFWNSRKYRSKGCISILLSGEPCVPDFNKVDYAISNVNLAIGKRHMYYPFYFMNSFHNRADMNVQDEGKNKFCNFIYSKANHSTKGTIYRTAFCKELMKYKDVDCLGAVLHNSDDQLLSERFVGNWENSKIMTQAKYRFSIAFENCLLDGYITEKIVDPLIAGSLPIYFGSEYVKRFVNPNCFIYANDFLNGNDGMKNLVDKVREVEENEDLYRSYFNQPYINKNAVTEIDEELDKFLIDVIEHGTCFDKDPYEFAIHSMLRQIPLHRDIIYRLNVLLSENSLIGTSFKKKKTN